MCILLVTARLFLTLKMASVVGVFMSRLLLIIVCHFVVILDCSLSSFAFMIVIGLSID